AAARRSSRLQPIKRSDHFSCFLSRELQPKAAAFAGLGFDAGFTAHAFDRPAHDGQANPCSGVVIGMNSVKHLKQALFSVRIDADAVILNPKAHTAIVSL